jgi:hypothetical protein
MTDKELPWDPDEVIARPKEPTTPEKKPLTDKERESRERFDRYWESLTPEQRHARAERFVWKPGELRPVRGPEDKSDEEK